MSQPASSDLPVQNGDAYAVLRNRDFSCYLFGRFIAALGQQMLTMTLGWELYERTHSALALGLVGLTQVIPMFLFTLPAGHIADNRNRKHILVTLNAGLGIVCAGFAVISAVRAPVVWIYVCLAVVGTIRTFLWAASASFLPQLVERKQFAQAVNWNSSTFQLSCILGPLAAGGLIELTQKPALVYVVTATTMIVCSALVSLVRQRQVVTAREEMTLKSLLTGFKFVFASRIIVGIITLDLFAVLLGGAIALLPIYAKDILHVGPTGLGFLQTAMPVGAIVCSFILAHRPPLQKAGHALLWAVVGFGLATIGFGLSTWFWLSFAMLLVCGATDNVSVVVRHTLVQLLTPDEKRGRVSAVNNLFIGTSNELGGFESGTVAHWFGPAVGNAIATGAMISVVSGGVGTIFAVLCVAWIWPEIRKYGRLDAH
ncbi:MAG: MFS transporter [Verrucomicrobia bacterium]|nr:MFS transporter [Verrucomicrobiota bacterium]